MPHEYDGKTYTKGYCDLNMQDEDLFLSVTPNFEYGPGIQRDGITEPRMTHPQSVTSIANAREVPCIKFLPFTINGFEQRLGTWTLYKHVKEFVENNPAYQIVAVQSNGDLTMNPWHIAYIGKTHIEGQKENIISGLVRLGDPQEEVRKRCYRCLVKWNDVGAKYTTQRYQFLEI